MRETKIKIITNKIWQNRNMLLLVLLCLGFLQTMKIHIAQAEIPKYINFQGKITKASDGTNQTDGNYSMQFKIYDAPSGGNLLWTETWDGTGSSTQVNLTNGVFNVRLGSYSSLAGVDFTAGSLYLTLNFNSGSGYDGEMLPRKQLLTAAFAFNANNLVGDGRIAITTTSTTQSAMQVTYNPDSSTSTPAAVITASSNVTGPALKIVQNGSGAAALFTGGAVSIGTTSVSSTLYIQGSGATNPFIVASSTGSALLTVAINGSTTLSSLGTGIVRSSGGSLFSGAIALGSSDVSGILGVSNGGTGTSTAPTIQGQILADDGTHKYAPANLVAGSNITITTTTPGQITIAAAGGSGIPVGPLNSLQYNNGGSFGGTNSFWLNGYELGINSSTPIANLVIEGTSTAPTIPIFIIATNTNASLFTVAANGSTTLSSLGTGIVRSSAGALFNGVINLASADVGGVLGSSNGGIGTTTLGNLSLGSNLSFTSGDGKMIIIGTSTTISLGSNVITAVATGTNGNIFNISTSTNSLTINIPLASGVNTGQLQPADWLVFNNKLSGSLSANQVVYATSASSTAGSNNFVWINTTQSLGINSTTPQGSLVVEASSSAQTLPILNVASTSGVSFLAVTPGGNVGIGTSTASQTLTVIGSANILTSTNISTAFQVQNSNSAPIFSVDTTANNNLINNPGFEVNTTGWSASGTGVSIAKVGIHKYFGQSALQVNTGTAAGSGAFTNAFTSSLATSTAYTLSFYARVDSASSSFSTIIAGHADNGSLAACTLNTATVANSGWNKFWCNFTTGATVSNPNVFIGASDATSRTFYIDSVQLQTGNAATPYQIGNIQLRGIITNPVALQSLSNSVTAFQVQDTTGTTNLFIADTLNNKIGVGTTTPAVRFAIQGAAGSNDLFDAASSTGISAFHITIANNIGIGTTTPIAALQVTGSAINEPVSNTAIDRGLYISPNPLGTANTLQATDYRGFETSSYTLVLSSTTPVSQIYGSLHNQITINTTTVATLANAATVYINGAPKSTSNLTIASSTALTIIGGAVSTTTNAYALWLKAPTGASAGNYAAAFLGGNVGIGTATPQSSLYIQVNGATNPFTVASSTAATGSYFTILANGNVGIGTSTPVARFAVAANCFNFASTTPGNSKGLCTDYAEIYPSSEPTDKADIVSAGQAAGATNGLIKLSSQPYDTHMLGIVSTNPAVIVEGNSVQLMNGADYQLDPLSPAIALAGRVPLKIKTNEVIHMGDFITSSEIPGVGMKADHSGEVIGQALEDFDPSANTNPKPTILVFVKPGYQEISGSITLQILENSPGLILDNAQTDTGAILKNLLYDNSTSSSSLSLVATDRVIAGLDITTPKLTSKSVKVDDIYPALGSGVTINGSLAVGSESAGLTVDTLGDAVLSGGLSAATVTTDSLIANHIISPDFDFLHQQIQLLATVASSSSDTVKIQQQQLISLASSTSQSFTDLAKQISIATSSITALNLQTLLSTNSGLVFSGPVTFKQGVVLSGLSALDNGGISVNGDVYFVGRPYFTTDTAGFAVIGKGKASVDVVFDQSYLEQPIVNASITENLDASTTASSDIFAQNIFSNNIQFVITNKNTQGFTIVINKPSPVNLQFSWIALAVRSAKTFSSLNITLPASVGAEGQVAGTSSIVSSEEPEITGSSTPPPVSNPSSPTTILTTVMSDSASSTPQAPAIVQGSSTPVAEPMHIPLSSFAPTSAPPTVTNSLPANTTSQAAAASNSTLRPLDTYSAASGTPASALP